MEKKILFPSGNLEDQFVWRKTQCTLMVEHDEKNYDETKPPIPNYLFGLRNQALTIYLGWETRLCEGVLKFTRKWIFIQVLKLPGCHVQLANKSEYLKGNYSRLPGPKIGIDSELKGGVKKKFPRPFPIEQASTKLIKLTRTEKTNLVLQEDKVQEVLSLDQKVECWSFVNNFHSVDLLLRLWLV